MPRSRLPTQGDVFGGCSPPRNHARHPARRFKEEPAAGYAHLPGTGPAGETCGTCANCRIRENPTHTARYYKCALMVAIWTHGRASDVLVTSPACSAHQPGTPSKTGIA
jgi:hypothetical protein